MSAQELKLSPELQGVALYWLSQKEGGWAYEIELKSADSSS